MPSPFPGMNPYLEQEDVWQDFHLSFIVAASEQLQSQLPPGLFAVIRANEFFYDLSECDASDELKPDAVISASPGGTAVIRLPTTDTERESYIDVRETQSKATVAVIELLTRSTKYPGPQPHREQYLAHRISVLRKPIHFIEIDLLRGGSRLPGNEAPGSDYCALVSRWPQRPWANVWPIRLRESLPTLPVPLSDGVPDTHLDLQAVLHKVCESARYDFWIYQGAPDPPLPAEDAEWARQFVPGR